MRKVRVLVVEDSPTVRQRLVDTLATDPQIEVVGEAEDGKRAVELCGLHRPDVITMDMMMPVMSGLAATESIMAHRPTPILIVSASINRGELFKIYDALAAGAVDVLEKPTGAEADGVWERRLLSLVKLVANVKVVTRRHAGLLQLPKAASQTSQRRPDLSHSLTENSAVPLPSPRVAKRSGGEGSGVGGIVRASSPPTPASARCARLADPPHRSQALAGGGKRRGIAHY